MEKPKDTNKWLDGYKAGQRKLARTILESPIESVYDLAYLLAKLKAINDEEEWYDR